MNVLATIVVYRQRVSECITFSSLTQALQDCSELGINIDLLIYDNSEHPQPLVTSRDNPIDYHHDATNGGLASAYNYALDLAFARHAPWLLLFDQDTEVNSNFLYQLASALSQVDSNENVAAVVPRLETHGRTLSPLRLSWIDQSPLEPSLAGISPYDITAFNSGAAIRTTFMRHVGGFDRTFWLDYLDYWLFHLIGACGKSTFVLSATLQHSLSLADRDHYMSRARYLNYLSAESLFTRRFRPWPTKLVFIPKLLKRASKHLLARRDKWYAVETLRQAWKEILFCVSGVWSVNSRRRP